MRTSRSLVAATLLAAMGIGAAGVLQPAQATTDTTLTFSNATWNDGGGLSGTFTVSVDDNSNPSGLLYADITTTPGSSVTTGYTYIYSAAEPGIDTANPFWNGPGIGVDVDQAEGYAANEINLAGSGHTLFG